MGRLCVSHAGVPQRYAFPRSACTLLNFRERKVANGRGGWTAASSLCWGVDLHQGPAREGDTRNLLAEQQAIRHAISGTWWTGWERAVTFTSAPSTVSALWFGREALTGGPALKRRRSLGSHGLCPVCMERRVSIAFPFGRLQAKAWRCLRRVAADAAHRRPVLYWLKSRPSRPCSTAQTVAS